MLVPPTTRKQPNISNSFVDNDACTLLYGRNNRSVVYSRPMLLSRALQFERVRTASGPGAEWPSRGSVRKQTVPALSWQMSWLARPVYCENVAGDCWRLLSSCRLPQGILFMKRNCKQDEISLSLSARLHDTAAFSIEKKQRRLQPCQCLHCV